MGLVHELRRRAKAAIAPVICASAIAYFGYHLIQGDRGLYAYGRLGHQIERVKEALGETAAERRRLENRVNLLRPDGLDADMLDEQARAALGLVRKDERVIFQP